MRRPTVHLITAAALAASPLALGGVSASAQSDLVVTPLGVYDSGVGEGGSEIVAFHARTARMFITNGAGNRIDIVDIGDPDAPSLVRSVDMSPYGSGIQSVAVARSLVAVAVKADDPTGKGTLVTMRPNGTVVATYTVGVLPDSIAFAPDGRTVVVANEAEPVCDGETLAADPRGSISIVDTKEETVRTAGFGRWIGREDALRDRGVRIYFPGSNAAQDLEPEYVAIAPNGRTAFVTLQENNAVAVVDLERARVTRIMPLGTKDHGATGNGLDPSNEDDGIEIANWDVEGMYLPDAVVVLPGDRPRNDLLVTANEGDARDYDCYSEEARIGDFGLADPYAASDDAEDALGRLKTTTAFPTEFDDAGEITQAYAFGARSFTIWTRQGEVVFDSGDQLETITADEVPELFNAESGDPAEFDQRSDDKGPEPEALALGTVAGRTYAFVGLERTGGIAVFDITDPAAATFVTYADTSLELGDVSPEGIVFVPEATSPTGAPLLLVSFEVSGTTRVFEVG